MSGQIPSDVIIINRVAAKCERNDKQANTIAKVGRIFGLELSVYVEAKPLAK